MSTSQNRPRTSVIRFVAVAALGLFLPLACGVNPQPTDYGDDYEDNFMLGCSGIFQNGDLEGEPSSDAKVFADPEECQCIYDGLVEKVPFSEAKEFEEQQAEAESGADIEIPDNIASIIEDCATPV